MTKIQWTDETWNPITGCTKISEGCRHCYAEKMAIRLQKMGVGKYKNGFEPTMHPESLDEPLKWKKPRRIFVCSMSDVFEESVTSDFRQEMIDTMRMCPQHIFQVLTKRPEAYRYWSFPENVWLGVTVEDQRYIDRIEFLRYKPNIRFVSFEPLLSPILIDLIDWDILDWVIVGGESGPNARPMNPRWVREIRDKCARTATPFFFKQWGGKNKKKAGRILDGRTWDEFPIGDRFGG